MPKVTVIVATYNCSHTLRCALASVLDQTFTDFEVWVVGDCCTDDSEQVVVGFQEPRFNWTNLPQRVGTQSGPNNEGLKRARGEYIAYLGHDDLWFPWHLQTLVTTIEQSKADFVHAVTALLGPDRPPEGSGAPNSRRSLSQRWTGPSTWLHRRTITERCGFWPLPGNLIEGVDFVFQRRMHQAGFRCAGTGQLSVMKFPSPFWRVYARSSPSPQPDYLERMRRCPSDLHTSLLTQMVVEEIERKESRNIGASLRAFLAAVHWRVVDLYGMDRWPLSTYFKRKRRRYERRGWSVRGLTGDKAKLAPPNYQPGNS
jgi:glycosyltransferase involved in cell wall biosynthesis